MAHTFCETKDVVGQLIYNQTSHVEIEDRALAHLQMVIAAKLRRSENFLFSWDRGATEGSGRESIWISVSTAIEFRYRNRTRTPMNRSWIDELMMSANSPGGLLLVPEPTS